MTPQAQQQTKAPSVSSAHARQPARSGAVVSRLPRTAPGERAADPGHGFGGAAWLLLPVLCCGAPLLLAAAATLGALAWGALGAAAVLLAGIALIAARRRSRRCRTLVTEGPNPSVASHTPEAPVSR